ncbi:histone H4 [Obelidium mucronatum]|nr:histone H4 [Obelidium mucronatum]
MKTYFKVRSQRTQRITKPTIERCISWRSQAHVWSETQRIASTFGAFLETVIRDAVAYMMHAQRKTITSLDVVCALKRQGLTIYGFGG